MAIPSSIQSHIRSSLHQLETPVEVKEDFLNAAISIVFYAKNGVLTDWHDLDLLFMQRAEHPKDPWSGHIAFPGGAVEAEDPHTLGTAIRETHEELGFVLDDGHWLGSMTPIYGPVIGDKKKVHLYPHVFLIDQRPELVLNEEAQSAFWVPMTQLSQTRHVNRFEHPFLPQQQMFGIDLGGHVNVPLWGLSLEVLYQFFQASKWQVEQDLVSFQR